MTGLTSDWVLAVDRAGTMRLFVYWDPTDGIGGVVRALLRDGRMSCALSEVPLEPRATFQMNTHVQDTLCAFVGEIMVAENLRPIRV